MRRGMDAVVWVLGAATVLGALHAVPPFLQHVCGRPRIWREPTDMVRPDRVHCLVVHIRNGAIRSRLLRMLRVRRLPAEHVSTKVEVREEGTGRLLAASTSNLCRGQESLARLPSGAIGLVIISWGSGGGRAHVCDDVHGRAKRALSAGRYVAHVVVDWEEGRIEITRPFDVSCAAPSLRWVDTDAGGLHG